MKLKSQLLMFSCVINISDCIIISRVKGRNKMNKITNRMINNLQNGFNVSFKYL